MDSEFENMPKCTRTRPASRRCCSRNAPIPYHKQYTEKYAVCFAITLGRIQTHWHFTQKINNRSTWFLLQALEAFVIGLTNQQSVGRHIWVKYFRQVEENNTVSQQLLHDFFVNMIKSHCKFAIVKWHYVFCGCSLCFLCPLYWYGLTLITVWISNHMSSEVWDEMSYLFPNVSRFSSGMDRLYQDSERPQNRIL